MNPDEIQASVATTRRRLRLNWYEDQIRKRAFSLAAIFTELRDDRDTPWLITHATFEEYCEGTWGMTRRRLAQIATGEATRALLAAEAPAMAPTITAMPEGQLRELAGMPAPTAVAVLQVVAATPGKTTAAKIRQAKARVIDVTPGAPAPGPATTQLEFSFAIAAEADDIEWFKALDPKARGAIVHDARQRAGGVPA